MDYRKVTVNISPFEEWLSDILTSQLGESGFESFINTETGFEAFLPENLFQEETVEMVLEPFSENFKFEILSEKIEDRNWNEEWEKNYFKPLIVAQECVVRAPFHTDYPEAKHEIVIEPNMAFGTGNHETTSMMLEYILENNVENKTVLDMGCGTGILGILASMKGAKNITAIDIDEWSFKGTQENTTLNRIENIEVKLGDVSLLGEDTYDFIFANIQRNVLLADLPAYSRCLNTKGKVFLSGFYKNDIMAIKKRAEEFGLKDSGYKIKNNWVAHAFTKIEK
ncbi:50S ribosomal protein L11 methyltransferase [Maribellus comscasis]|uniref:Ribosomal protein L11 methyltransferase n=1 Tax=Maribellus comscasis TaxID=2681766 RepID=A0A6I6JZA3_9BACT|nr:50S ribosomal protein L11 methyltransferase [Maribellus comscasis]QGY45542.1 50S ribosomal protein L11 methyltransferase [Maribellus comscasis]